ncbi:MAG: hypothetical protein JNM86_11440 [Phycisphaerae bacterium]|nr:hypothetical protein [Phycisphaerae bacterium]
MSETNEAASGPRNWRKVLVHEFFEYIFNFIFLSFFLVSFAWYRRLLLASYGIEYTGYWAPLISAAVLAKVIMIGDVLRVGRRLRDWPLAFATIYRTLAFSVLVVVFSIAEHLAGALVHGKKMSEGISELTSTGWQGLLAWYVLIIAAFLPFFTVKEIEQAFGAGKVRALFFSRRPKETAAPVHAETTNG